MFVILKDANQTSCLMGGFLVVSEVTQRNIWNISYVVHFWGMFSEQNVVCPESLWNTTFRESFSLIKSRVCALVTQGARPRILCCLGISALLERDTGSCLHFCHCCKANCVESLPEGLQSVRTLISLCSFYYRDKRNLMVKRLLGWRKTAG